MGQWLAGFESRLVPDLPLPFTPTLIGLRAFDLVSSPVWWEAATNKYRWLKIVNITPHSPDDGSVEAKRYCVDLSINLSFHLDRCYQFFYILSDYNPLFTFHSSCVCVRVCVCVCLCLCLCVMIVFGMSLIIKGIYIYIYIYILSAHKCR